MRYSNEFKVGLAIVVTAAVAFFGIRYLAGLSFFGTGYELVAVFDDTEGLTSGNPVTVSGVQIGTVRSVELLPGAGAARAVLAITSDTPLPRGTVASIGGFSALGDVRVTLDPGPAAAPPLDDGDTLITEPTSDLLGLVENNAERVFGNVDTLLIGAAGTFSNVDALLNNESSDLRATLTELRGAAASANQLLASQRDQIAATLAGLRSATEGVNALTGRATTFADENADSLAVTISRLNGVLATVDESLASFETTSAELDAVLTKLNEGEGTLGLMLNDPTLYNNLNTAATNLNQLVLDFQADPKRYLRELRLVDVF
jgi:phospholipid/cholesterol/gamma-HCH transport system substrate-binding protein